MRFVAALAALALPLSAPALTLDEALATAEKNDPRLEALRAEREATLREQSFANRILSQNPEIGIVGGPVVGGGDTDFEYSIAIEQPLHLGGQGSARSAAIEAALQRVQAQRQARQSELQAEVRAAFARAIAARERDRIMQESLALAQQAASAAQRRFEAGRIPRIERNGARVEQARAVREAAQAGVAISASRADLRELLGLSGQVPIEVEGALAHKAVPRQLEPTEGEGRDLPALQAARLEKAEASARRDLADAGGIPDLRIGGAFEHEVGTNKYFATLAIPLPLFDRNDVERAEASRELARSEAALVETTRRTTADLERAAARLDTSGAALVAYEAEALDALNENLELATTAYEAGDIGFTTWLLLRREALEGRLAWIDALEELALAQAAYEQALGR